MSFFLIFFVIIGTVGAMDDYYDDDSDLNEHIVGGHDTDIKQYPFIVSLQIFGYHFCGGSIYTSTFVLTAAHCIKNPINLKLAKVVAGSTTLKGKGQYGLIKTVYVHPKYVPLRDHDIGILELKEPFTFGDLIQPISLATARPPVGSKVIALGWGFKSENMKENTDHLQEVIVSVVENDVCKVAYDQIKKDLITPFILCAGSSDGTRDACSYDSGGPLVFENQLVGIVSFGLGCARKGYPGLYGSIADHYDWIIENTKNVTQ